MNIKKITFVDEKPFEIGTLTNRQNTRYYKRMSQKHTIPAVETTKFSTKIHTFCAINWNGKSQVKLYIKEVLKKRGKGKRKIHLPMDSETTIESLADYLHTTS